MHRVARSHRRYLRRDRGRRHHRVTSSDDPTRHHRPDKSIVAIISGHGLKTLDAVVDTATVSSTISASLSDAEEALRFHQLVSAS